jgi:superfamily II DNA/RNA helicase
MTNIKEQIVQYLQKHSIVELTPMQDKMLAKYDIENNIVLYSPTGSGKTIGFLLPLLLNLDRKKKDIQAIIVVPTRELAIQIEQVFKKFDSGFKVNACYGGHSMKTERNNFSSPPALLVGTPGRLADHINRQHFDTDSINTIVLDEFDKSLEMGFEQEMKYIIKHLPNTKKRILTSATQMQDIPEYAMSDKPIIINFAPKENNEISNITHKTVEADGNDKLEVLFNLLCELNTQSSLVFCNHRDAVNRISVLLKERGIEHDTFHGGMEQEERERSLIKFRNGSYHTLITTDLASRGLDIPEIKNIIHYQLPNSLETYTHRNGRTARMNADGTSYMVLSETEYIPDFIKDKHEIHNISDEIFLPEPPIWLTLYIGLGKKDKVNKIDIVGLLCKKANLEKHDIGIIEVLDNVSYVAVNREKAKQIIKMLKEEKIKNKKVKICYSK